jgi:hypothetical protein
MDTKVDLKEIISISGRPGLYKVIARSAKNFIVESIEGDKTRLSVNATQQVAILDEITVYTTTEENIPLKTIFENMEKRKSEGSVPSPKDNPVDIREFFKFAAPGYDPDRVYISDMKKMLKWFEIISSFKQEEPTDKQDEPVEEQPEPTEKKVKAKKA